MAQNLWLSPELIRDFLFDFENDCDCTPISIARDILREAGQTGVTSIFLYGGKMSTRMALGSVRSLALMLQTSPHYPTKPVRLLEPFGAGGGPDLVGRALAQKLAELLSQPVTVENILGAGVTAGHAQVEKSPADGYTLLVNTSAQPDSAALLKNLPFNRKKGTFLNS